jgi:hypothetical protein
VSGDRRIEGTIVAVGPKVQPFSQTPMLVDIAPTLLAALDAAASIKHTGRVLHEVVGTEATVKAGEQVEFVESTDAEPTVSDTDADEMEEHLRGLGYLE